MSFVSTQPGAMAAAASTLQGIGYSVGAVSAGSAEPTTAVAPAAADEVSTLTAVQFAAHGRLYQAVNAQAAAIHQMFVDVMQASAESYAVTEAANAAAAG